MCRRDDEDASITPIGVYLSLGSNLGDRHAALRQGVHALSLSGVAIQTCSSFYETEPVGIDDQPWFLNCVVKARTSLSPTALLAECKRIETRTGRVPSPRFGPRILDIDILLYDRRCIDLEGLVIPHPRMLERAFVLTPLLEIAPECTDPRTGQPYAAALAGLDEGKKVRKLTPSEYSSP